jgi:hypothetical protein
MKWTFFFATFVIIFAFAAFQLIIPITSWASQKKTTSVIRGVVASQYGMVEGARVRIAGGNAFSLTDTNGLFTLETPLFSSRAIKITAGRGKTNLQAVYEIFGQN